MYEKTIFQKIIDREIPAHIVYEDDHFIVFLDIHPRGPGHCQVVPKQVFRWVWDLPAQGEHPPTIPDYFQLVQKVALAQKKAFGVECIRSNIAGEEVPHAHVWIWPEGASGDLMDFETHAEQIRRALLS